MFESGAVFTYNADSFKIGFLSWVVWKIILHNFGLSTLIENSHLNVETSPIQTLWHISTWLLNVIYSNKVHIFWVGYKKAQSFPYCLYIWQSLIIFLVLFTSENSFWATRIFFTSKKNFFVAQYEFSDVNKAEKIMHFQDGRKLIIGRKVLKKIYQVYFWSIYIWCKSNVL